MSTSRLSLPASALLGASIWLVGCGALPVFLGFGGAVAAKAGETAAFPNVSSAILAWERSDVLRATFEALQGFGVAKAMVQEKEGIVDAIEASIDGRSVFVTISPALDGRATRVTIHARLDWMQTDPALQAAILSAITDRLKGVPHAVPVRSNPGSEAAVRVGEANQREGAEKGAFWPAVLKRKGRRTTGSGRWRPGRGRSRR